MVAARGCAACTPASSGPLEVSRLVLCAGSQHLRPLRLTRAHGCVFPPTQFRAVCWSIACAARWSTTTINWGRRRPSAPSSALSPANSTWWRSQTRRASSHSLTSPSLHKSKRVHDHRWARRPARTSLTCPRRPRQALDASIGAPIKMPSSTWHGSRGRIGC